MKLYKCNEVNRSENDSGRYIHCYNFDYFPLGIEL